MTPAFQLENQTARPPAAVRGAQVADDRLDLGAYLPRVRPRRVGTVSQPVKPAFAVTNHHGAPSGGFGGGGGLLGSFLGFWSFCFCSLEGLKLLLQKKKKKKEEFELLLLPV